MEMQPERGLPSAAPAAPSFREVFERELDFVWNCLRRLGIPERDLEDEALEVFLRVQNALHEYDAARSIRPWLSGFAYRVACEYRRRPRHRFERMQAEVDRMAPGLDAQPSLDTPEQSAVAGEERAMVVAALDRLSEDRRAVLVLHD